MTESVKELMERFNPGFSLGQYGNVHYDTSDFMSISYGDVIVLDGLHYAVLRDESERRFGMEDPKFWVKRCRLIENGEWRILKLVFHESFVMNIGEFTLNCYRSPEKEARILRLVEGDKRFMQGITVRDAKNNPVRVLDVVRGKRLDLIVEDIEADHETYFFEILPDILDKFIESCEAIAFLHSNWEKHGDIRRDHLWVEYGSGQYVWIDFDYTFEFRENPFGLDIFGLSNILLFLTGKGTPTMRDLTVSGFSEKVLNSITEDDYSIIIPNRIVNLRKVYPYICEKLNNVLIHFSNATEVFYDNIAEFLDDLRPCVDEIRLGAYQNAQGGRNES